MRRFVELLECVNSVNVVKFTYVCLLSQTYAFHSQHRTPTLPQAYIDEKPSVPVRINVGYLIHRWPYVKPALHPLELEMSYILEKEHARYCRHEEVESVNQFMAKRNETIDIANRNDSKQIKSTFFPLQLYRDAMKATLQRYSPSKCTTVADVVNIEHWLHNSAQLKHTLQRKLDEYLYLIVEEDESGGKWTIPFIQQKPKESLKISAIRAIEEHHNNNLQCYWWSNAPQGTVFLPEENIRLFIFTATYLSGRPQFDKIQPVMKNHAWVSRNEMKSYRKDFKSNALLDVLLDISTDSTFGV